MAPGSFQGQIQPIPEHPAVRQTGETVEVGQEANPLLIAFSVGDVLDSARHHKRIPRTVQGHAGVLVDAPAGTVTPPDLVVQGKGATATDTFLHGAAHLNSLFFADKTQERFV